MCPETNEAPSKFAFLHTALDIVGVFWDGADLINAGLYLAEGDYENAVISVVSAIPLVGSAVGTGVKLFTKENLLCAANAALGVVAGVAAAKGIKSDVKAFKKIAGAEKAAESVTKTSQRVAADAESQLEKTAERSLYYEDVNTANSYNNVKVYDITRMSDRKLKKILNSEDVTICAWCYSERSNDVINAVR